MKKSRKKPIHPYIVALGEELKRIRLQRKLSLGELGSEMGIGPSNVQKIELGQNLTFSTFLKHCICLNTAPAKVLERLNWDLTEDDIDQLTIAKKPSKKKKARNTKN